MKTYLDCIPCFFRQLLDAARIANVKAKKQKQIIDEFAKKIPKISLEASPPEIARVAYKLLKKLSSNDDPYKAIKQKSNRSALNHFRELKNKVNYSKDRLLAALKLAIAGNIIDFGVNPVRKSLNVDNELKRILKEKNKSIRKNSIFHYREFLGTLKTAKNILYLADNAGEVVFDRILIEEIKRIYPDKNIYYVVKAKPIINDALFVDANVCGINNIAQIISNGIDAPGTILSLCSKNFKKIYKRVDMIISKGQGNFESLDERKKPVFFLFMVKCPVVSRETGCKIGDRVLLSNLVIS
ncbi:MAG: ARMT1-like domain-containing protein [Candidatus Hydrogenedentota bacterium]